MTYLLKNEIDNQEQKNKQTELEIKVDTLTKLLLPNHTNNFNNSGIHMYMCIHIYV